MAALGIYVGKALPGHHAPSSAGATTASVPSGDTGTERRRLEFAELHQPAVDPATGCIGASAGDQRIDLMAEACAPADSQHVYRTRALGTIAELVTDADALFAASDHARTGARAHRPRGQPVPERLGAEPVERRRRD